MMRTSLLIVSFLTFSERLLNRLEYTKDNAQEIFEWNDSKKETYFLDLQNVFKPFTFYNEDVDNCLADFILIYKNPALKN